MPKQRREYKLYNEEIERTFTQHQTEITQLDDSITLQASTITSLDGKVEEYYSELVLADQGITSTVATKVGADSIISTITNDPTTGGQTTTYTNINGVWDAMAMNMLSFPFSSSKATTPSPWETEATR